MWPFRVMSRIYETRSKAKMGSEHNFIELTLDQAGENADTSASSSRLLRLEQ